MNITRIPYDVWDHSPTDTPTKCGSRPGPVKYIVLHTTGGKDSRDWLARWNRRDPKSVQNEVSIHYLVSRSGSIYQIIEEDKRAWHVGVCRMPDGETDGNGYSIGIEIEHFNEPDFPEAQLNALAELVYDITARHNIDGNHVVSHASVALPKGRKIDPVNFDWADLWDRIAKLRPEPTPIKPNPSAQYVYSKESFLINTPTLDAEKVASYIASKKRAASTYTEGDLRLIVSYYKEYGDKSTVDWIFALAQCIHETGWWTSWWSARPRRNPAGLGVTGEKTTKDPKDSTSWAFDGKIWKKGYSYPSWDIAVQQHLSRLLCYALRDENMSPQQLKFSELCTSKPRLARIRGCSEQVSGLNGIWAVPGTTYAQTICEIANTIVQNCK